MEGAVQNCFSTTRADCFSLRWSRVRMETQGEGMKTEPRALSDIQQYVRNLAFWLAPPL
jgi:hypothetical protein